MNERAWTLETARALLPEVRRRTEAAVKAADPLFEERALHEDGSAQRVDVERRLQATVERWAREMEALGLEVKGLWLVDFDSGGGYFCWQWPEEALEYFHGYEDGFAGRTRIQ
jgi:hypothetical protein